MFRNCIFFLSFSLFNLFNFEQSFRSESMSTVKFVKTKPVMHYFYEAMNAQVFKRIDLKH